MLRFCISNGRKVNVEIYQKLKIPDGHYARQTHKRKVVPLFFFRFTCFMKSKLPCSFIKKNRFEDTGHPHHKSMSRCQRRTPRYAHKSLIGVATFGWCHATLLETYPEVRYASNSLIDVATYRWRPVALLEAYPEVRPHFADRCCNITSMSCRV